jgi:iron complex transport system substrate-binding protein
MSSAVNRPALRHVPWSLLRRTLLQFLPASSFGPLAAPAAATLIFATLIAILVGATLTGGLRAQSKQPTSPSVRKTHGATGTKVTDEMGRVIELLQPVRRIVSLAPSVTETLFALGLGDRVVGDTTYCDYPVEAKSKARVGGPIDPNIEQIAALHPDLVVATRSINRQTTVNSLQHLGIAVYVTDPRTVEQVLDSTARLGHLIRAGDDATPNSAAAANGNSDVTLVADLRRRVAGIREQLSGAPPKSVFFVVWQEPLITVGRNTFLADALRWAGARLALEAAQDWPNVSLEAVVRAQPEYLIFSNDDREQARRQIDQLRNQPGWRQLEAMRGGRIIVLPEAISHPSPRLVDAIEELARALYPDRFAAATRHSLNAPDVPDAPAAFSGATIADAVIVARPRASLSRALSCGPQEGQL